MRKLALKVLLVYGRGFLNSQIAVCKPNRHAVVPYSNPW